MNITKLTVCFAALSLASCVNRLDDEQLTAAVRPPAGYSYFGGEKPSLRTWADFHFYRRADIELQRTDRRWAGYRVIPGVHTAVVLNEGSKIENTTAHPQYYELYIALPADLQPGQVIPLRTADSRRVISRQKPWSHGIDSYSLAAVGEVAVDGMKGYDVPVVRPRTSKRVGKATVLAVSPSTMTLKIEGIIPLRFSYGDPETHYNLKVQRTYDLRLKSPDNG